MLTDWLIFLDILEENNYNTSFLRLVTPITFGIFECHRYNYSSGSGYSDGFGYGDGNGYGNGSGSGSGSGFGNYYVSGNGSGNSFVSSNDEEH